MKLAFWINFILLVTIQSLDMALTERYIGNNWKNETFPIMSWMIKEIGIHPALWICRIFTYICLFGCLRFRKYEWITDSLTIINLCYWTAMTGWLFSLRIINWPIGHNGLVPF